MGTWTTNGFLYRPALGESGAPAKGAFDAGLDRVDARLGKQVWAGDPGRGATLQEAVKAIGAREATLHLPPGTWAVPASCTVPPNVDLDLERGAVLAVGAGATLTIDGGLTAGPHRIFSYPAKLERQPRPVVFGGGRARELYPQWWGAAGDGVTDDTLALRAAILAAAGDARRPAEPPVHRHLAHLLVIPPGRYVVRRTLVIEASRFHIRGAGAGGLWGGVTIIESAIPARPGGQDVIAINPGHTELDGATLEGLKIVGNGAERHGISCASRSQHDCVWRDVRVGDVGGDGWHFEGEGFLNLHENCMADHCGGWGFSFVGHQAWATGNKKTLGQSSLVHCNAEFNDRGGFHVGHGLDVKVFGGTSNGRNRDNTDDVKHTWRISDTWGIDLFGTNVERGLVGVQVDGYTIRANLFGGRVFDQRDTCVRFDHEVPRGGCHAAGGLWGTVLKGTETLRQHVVIGKDAWGAVIDGWTEAYGANGNALRCEDRGYMTWIAPRILATRHGGRACDPTFGVTHERFANLSNPVEDGVLRHRDGMLEWVFNPPREGLADGGASVWKTRGLFYLGCEGQGRWNEGHLVLGSRYHLFVDAEGRLRIKDGAVRPPSADRDGEVVGGQHDGALALNGGFYLFADSQGRLKTKRGKPTPGQEDREGTLVGGGTP
ncbi:MAG TPA: hypothetical protein VGQ83_30140 [Polyangia bacterium]|jgi:hypothetical protein